VGHWFLGIGDFIVEAYLLILVVVFVIAAAYPLYSAPPGASRDAWGVAVFLGLILALEKWLTIHHCRRFIREFIPKE
jgi:hypothetical protein